MRMWKVMNEAIQSYRKVTGVSPSNINMSSDVYQAFMEHSKEKLKEVNLYPSDMAFNAFCVYQGVEIWESVTLPEGSIQVVGDIGSPVETFFIAGDLLLRTT